MSDQTRGEKAAVIFKIVCQSIVGILIVVMAIFFFTAYSNGYFETQETMEAYIKSFGLFGPVILTLFQMMQVLIPIFPSMLGYAVGGIMFGTIGGFLCNYIGITIGSIISFWLAKLFGVTFVKKVVSPEKYEKYVTKIGTKKNYERFLIACFILPLAPDDFLCLFSGVCNFDTKRFVIITILTKPWCLILYSYLFSHFGVSTITTLLGL